MTIKSEDVRPTKVVKKQVTKKPDGPASSKEELEEAIKRYQESVVEASGGKVLMKMERDNMSFLTDGGVRFTADAPFQLVEESEVDLLVKQNFRRAYPEEVSEYYERNR